MKQIRINKQFLVLIICLVSILAIEGKGQAAPQDLNLTLRGEKAIERLEQDGSYNSLIRAVKTDRRKNEPSQEESLTAQETKLFTPDSGDQNFGISVAISGNTAIVGETSATIGGNLGQGAAYIYILSGGIWTLQQKITAFDGVTANGNFGISVAISGDTAVVGRGSIDPPTGAAQNGVVYVFIRTGTVWTLQQELFPSDNHTTQNRFGRSVALENDTLVVGSPDALVTLPQGIKRGAAYIYTRINTPSGVIWTDEQKIFTPDFPAIRGFGNAVAISANTVVVGELPGSDPNVGAAYFFTRNGTTWTRQQEVTASDGTNGDGFGWSVAINGDTAIIGALRLNDPNQSLINLGSAYVLTRSGTTWTEQQKLIPSDGAANKGFGRSVSMSGNAAIIGAFADTLGRGSAYIFTGTGTTWTQQQKLIPSDGTTNGQFGTSVGISGNTAIVGAPNNTTDPTFQIRPGEAYIFTGLSLGNVTVSGRVTTPDGRGLRNASVSITDSNNVRRTATTSSFGFFSFEDVAVGGTYVIRVSSRLYRYTPQTVMVNDNLTLPDFVGLE